MELKIYHGLLFMIEIQQILSNSAEITRWARHSLKGYFFTDYIVGDNSNSIEDCILNCFNNNGCLMVGFNELRKMCYLYDTDRDITYNHVPDSDIKYYIPLRDYCPPTFIYVASARRCVYISDDVKSADDARATCHSLNSTNILLETTSDLNFIKNNFPYLNGDMYIAAGSNKFAGDLDDFEWLNGNIISDDVWCPGEPDRTGVAKSVGISPSDNFCLRDRRYTNTYNYICEIFV